MSNILSLGGDAPKGLEYRKADDDFQHAADLVRFIRKFNESKIHPDRRGFGIGVAGFPEGHPATPNRLLEMDYLKQKVDAGADYIVTQLFFDNRDFLDFRDRCELAGINVPIVAGIMPITSISGMKRMAELAAGARFPARLLRSLHRCQDDPESVARVGIHHASEQCRDLLEHKVRGIHFYTLNRSDATRRIFESLGLKTLPLEGDAARVNRLTISEFSQNKGLPFSIRKRKRWPVNEFQARHRKNFRSIRGRRSWGRGDFAELIQDHPPKPTAAEGRGIFHFTAEVGQGFQHEN